MIRKGVFAAEKGKTPFAMTARVQTKRYTDLLHFVNSGRNKMIYIILNKNTELFIIMI